MIGPCSYCGFYHQIEYPYCKNNRNVRNKKEKNL